MDTTAFLNFLQSQDTYNDQIVHIERISPRGAKYTWLDEPLSPVVQASLKKRGIAALYSHQAEAVNHSRQGKNVMVATSSASGKSLVYNIAVTEKLLAEPEGRAIYLFPTKALAQDQLRVLREMFSPAPFSAQEMSTFDGDTPQAERAGIRNKARIILTNPDMLHVGILPNHRTWARVLRNLKYVVIDEAHIYQGVFGSHVAGVIRRLRRLCRLYGSAPVFICCSATIANPGEHAEKLTGLPFTVVDNDGSPHGGKEFVFWEPPVIDEKKSTRRSANSEATHLFSELVTQEVRTLAFAHTRRVTELIYVYTRDRLKEEHPRLAERIRAYRAGYLPPERRQIERDLFSGRLLGVVATVALELGIDIGGLDATILNGYPGSIASTWQQAGRSGRGKEQSISFLIGWDNPLDQYIMHHPEAFFGKNVENALVNPGNHYILRAHLLCAAWEIPLTDNDEVFFGPLYKKEREELEKEGLLRERRFRWHLSPGISYPARAINIRSTSGENYLVIDTSTGAMLETVEAAVAFFQVHPGAIYLHQGESYIITRLDLAGHTAYAAPTSATYYTMTKEVQEIRVTRQLQSRKIGNVTVYVGEVEVTNDVVGFKKKAQYTDEVIGEEPLDLPTIKFPTISLWFDLPPEAVSNVDRAGLDFAGGLHAVEHAAISMLPLFALCDRNDIGGVSTPLHPDTGNAQIFIYDAYPGGIGIAERGFELIEQLWQATLNAINDCPCEEGCPSCIQSPKCGNNNKPLDKAAARLLLEGLIKQSPEEVIIEGH
jgi:DEAD/DEAH box helicase domain-containing protein